MNIASSSPAPRRAFFPSALINRLTCIGILWAAVLGVRAETPTVGSMAPDFTLKTMAGESTTLSKLAPADNVVLVVLRGWPGYQCPFCTTQVYEYVSHAADFAAKNTKVVMVYPGPSDELQAHAEEFLKDKRWPDGFIFLLDPDYEFTNRYTLRWTGKNETAYPATFILDQNRKVRFAHVSHEHGDRISAAAVLRFLNLPTPMAKGE